MILRQLTFGCILIYLWAMMILLGSTVFEILCDGTKHRLYRALGLKSCLLCACLSYCAP